MFTNNQLHNLAVIGLMTVYSVLCFVVPEILGSSSTTESPKGIFALLIGSSPSWPLAVVLIIYVQRLLGLDEFQQRVQLLSLAVASGIVLIGATAYGFITLHLDYPAFPLFLILPVFLAIWAVTGMVIKGRYK